MIDHVPYVAWSAGLPRLPGHNLVTYAIFVQRLTNQLTEADVLSKEAGAMPDSLQLRYL